MITPRTISDVLAGLHSPSVPRLTAPPFQDDPQSRDCLALGVASMKEHMTDEGWQITHGLAQNGYYHAGYDLTCNTTDVRTLLSRFKAGTLVLQDKREWSPADKNNFRDPKAKFKNVPHMAKCDNLFRLTILKDSHQNPEWHSQAATEMGCHAWIVYYHPRIVSHLAPYVRPQHLIRTWHTIDATIVPTFSTEREGCLFSGAISNAYPLRQRIEQEKSLPITRMPHPGYHRKGSNTPEFLRILNNFKVSICTSSRYGYSLRKIIESTACGCRVITDLPVDDIVPGIDDNLIRIHPDISMQDLRTVISEACYSYNYDRQKHLAEVACTLYHYTSMTAILAHNIDHLRRNYP